MEERDGANSNFSYFPIVLENDYKMTRDELYNALRMNNIYSRKYFCPITADQACFRNRYRNTILKNARELSKRILTIPFYEKISNEKMDKVMNIIAL